MKNLKIDIVSDVMCPWCIVGYKRLEKALESMPRNLSIEIEFHPFEMNPDLPQGGQNLWENTSLKYGMTVEESYASREQFITLGKELGFTFNFNEDTRMYNTHKAHQLLMWSEQFSKKRELKLALFTAHFTKGKVMDNIFVLASIAQSVGLKKEQALEIIRHNTLSEKLLAEEQYWHNAGVRSVPSFLINQKYRISGAQEPKVFTETLLNIAAEKPVLNHI